MATNSEDVFVESPTEAHGLQEASKEPTQSATQPLDTMGTPETAGATAADPIPQKYLEAMESITRKSIKRFGRKMWLEDKELGEIGCTDADKPLDEIKRAMILKWLEKFKDQASDKLLINALQGMTLYEDAHRLRYDSVPEQEQGTDNACATAGLVGPEQPCGANTSHDRPKPMRSVSQPEGSVTTEIPIRQPCELFTGKAHIECCQKIAERYKRHREKYRDSHRVLVEILHGLGGCGKSEILCQYVWKHRSEYKGKVFVMNGQSSSYIDYGLKKLLINAKVERSDDESTPSNIRRWALELLHECKDWLLVIDNALDPELIQYYFPNQPQLHGGHILITSRVSQGWNNWYNAVKTPVPLLTPEDSAIYLLRRQQCESDDAISVDDAKKRLETLKEENPAEYEAVMWLGDEGALQGLPLALFQASMYISTCKVNFKKYKELFCKCRFDVLRCMKRDPLEAWLWSNGLKRKFGPAIREIVHTNTIVVKNLTDQQLQQTGMDAHELATFKQACQDTDIGHFAQMVDPSNEDMLTTWKMNYDQVCSYKIAKEFMQLCSCLSSRIQVALLVDGVHALKDSDLKNHLLAKHRGGKSGCQTEVHERVLELYQCLQQFSFATMIVGQSEQSRDKSDKSNLNRLGAFTVPNLLKEVVFLKLISRDEKIRSLNHALNMLEKLFPKIEDVQLDRIDILYSEAVKEYHSIIALHTLALAHQMASLEEDDVTDLNNTNRLFSSVGIYLRRLGRFRDAKLLYKLMAKFSKWRKPPRNNDLAEELRCLGKVYYNMKQFRKAENCFLESRELFTTLNGEDHITVAYAMQGLGRVLQNDKDYMQSEQNRNAVEKLLMDTLAKKIEYFKTTGENDHYSIAHAKHQLGRFYQDTGDCAKAYGYLQESFDMMSKYWERKYGTIVAVDVAMGMTNLARNFLVGNGETRNVDKAEELLVKAEKIKVQRMPASNESYQLALYYLATLYREKGQTDKSQEHFDKIILHEYRQMHVRLGKADNTKFHEVYPPEKTIWM